MRLPGMPPPVMCAMACTRDSNGFMIARYERCTANNTSATVASEPGNGSSAASCIRSETMRRASEKSKEHAVAEGIAIAREMLGSVKSAVQGVQVSAPTGSGSLGVKPWWT